MNLYNLIDKILVGIIILTVIAMFSFFMFVDVPNYNGKQERCDQLNGVMVKSFNQWICIDARKL